MKQNYPKSRTDEIVVQELNGEILVYDLRDNRAMALNKTSSLVWKECDGSNSVEDIAKKVGNEDVVWLALDELKKERLIDSSPAPNVLFGGMSRREVIRKIGMGSMVALPLITGLIAPPAASAASCGGACNNDGDCTSPSCPRCLPTTGQPRFCAA